MAFEEWVVAVPVTNGLYVYSPFLANNTSGGAWTQCRDWWDNDNHWLGFSRSLGICYLYVYPLGTSVKECEAQMQTILDLIRLQDSRLPDRIEDIPVAKGHKFKELSQK